MIPLRLEATEIDLHKDTISNDRCVVILEKDNTEFERYNGI